MTNLVRVVAEALVREQTGAPLRVGVDGICGAGKSTFTRALVKEVESSGRPAIHVDSDGFHHVRDRRRRNTVDQARGYYEDAYDFDALAELVLRPLGPGGSRRYARRVHDLVTDAVITDDTATAPPDAVVLFDATFLQQPRLEGLWDLVIYLHSDEEAAVERGVDRDADALGGRESARAAYDARYMAACRIYLAERQPRERASMVVDNSDPRAPVMVRLP
ncbi:uridine kinase [Nocardioides seonyuensis]|uniref:Uridine kinase n=1 Tax=Nocardioides seonyuensis TaxID=2518371 RepID=A0A4P7IG00_9ACTN|nr:uridine kinase [Nocardioides seonyuensis]QBX54937.1 uridine kinase [Nocardioides seonyuensis]